jgi:hypothetical protein
MGPKARARSKLRDPSISPDTSPSGKGSDNDPDTVLEIENFLANQQTTNATTLPTRQPPTHPNPLIRSRVPSGEPPGEPQLTLSTTAPTSPMAPLPPKRSKRIVERDVGTSKAKEVDKGKAKANPPSLPPQPPVPFVFSSVPSYPIPRYPPTTNPFNTAASSSNAIPLQPPFIPIPPQPITNPDIAPPAQLISSPETSPSRMNVSPTHPKNATTVPNAAPIITIPESSTPALFTSEQVSAAVSRGIAEALSRLEERDQLRSAIAVNGTSERPSFPESMILPSPLRVYRVHRTYAPACTCVYFTPPSCVYFTPPAVIHNVPIFNAYV